MADLETRCSVCKSLLDEEDLFCANCGTEAPGGAARADRGDVGRVATFNFECSSCGASMSYDAAARALRCPFCGSVDLQKVPDAKILAPKRVVPFHVSREQAEVAMRRYLGSSFWRPGDLAQTAALEAIAPVFVPYWVFEAHTHTYWTADTSQTPPGARADWFPLFGEHEGRHEGLLVGASKALRPGETAALCPFDLSAGVPPEKVDLDNVTVEQFSLARKYARSIGRRLLDEAESRACDAEQIPGRSRNVQVNSLATGLTSEPILLPIWIMAYRYRGNLFRFLVNGQTGRTTGEAPTAWWKLIVLVAGILAAILLVLAVAGLLAAAM